MTHEEGANKLLEQGIQVIYLAGQMSGLPDWGTPAFNLGADLLRSSGFTVFNPADNEGGDKTLPRDHYMKLDLNFIINEADAVVVLPNWKLSQGAKTEARVAQECGKKVFNLEDLSEVTEKIEIVVSDYVLR